MIDNSPVEVNSPPPPTVPPSTLLKDWNGISRSFIRLLQGKTIAATIASGASVSILIQLASDGTCQSGDPIISVYMDPGNIPAGLAIRKWNNTVNSSLQAALSVINTSSSSVNFPANAVATVVVATNQGS